MAKKVADDSYRVDTKDPVARFLTNRLGLDWHAVLLIALFIYGPLEKILIPNVAGYHPEFSSPMRTWIPDIQALVTGFVVFPFVFAYYIWSGRGIGRVFERLKHAKIFRDPGQFERFWTRAHRSFSHNGWWIVALVVALGAMAFWQFAVWSPHAAVPPWFDLVYKPPPSSSPKGDLGHFVYEYRLRPFGRGLSIFLIGCFAYALVQVVVREALTLYWLTRLWDDMEDDIVVQPYHHDNAGGLGAVGEHAVHLSAFVAVVLLFIVMGSFLPALRVPTQGVTFDAPKVVDGSLVGTWIVYFAFLGSAIRPLFMRPHELMCHARDIHVGVVSKELNELIERQQEAVSKGSDKLESISKRIDELKKVRSQIIEDVPVWPFTMELRIQLGLTSLPALLLPVAKFGLQKGFDQLVNMFTGKT